MSLDNNEVYYSKLITASSVIKNADGDMGGLFVSSTTGGTITIYDGTSASGKKLVDTFSPTAGQAYPFPMQFNDGLYIATTGAIALTVFFK